MIKILFLPNRIFYFYPMHRTNISSGTKWEKTVGYSRAVRIGHNIYVAGTTAVDGETIVGKGNSYEQAKFIFEKIHKALNEAGAEMEHVVRTRMYITDRAHWDGVAKAHGEVFKDIMPAATMVVVKALINDDLLVEIEADAAIEQF